MKNLETLKQLITIFYYGLYIIFYIAITLAIALYFAGDSIGTITMKGMENVNIKAKGIMIYTALGFTLYYFFILAIKALKDAIPFITKENPFNTKTCLQFYKAGKIMIGVGIGYIIFNFLTPLVLLSEIKIAIDHVTVAGLFLIIIGVFFLFFSEAFSQANNLKEENDLTI